MLGRCVRAAAMTTQSTPFKRSSKAASGVKSRHETVELIHGSAVFFQKKGVLLLGSSTVGKSDLALRLIDAGGMLIADDQVRLKRKGEQLHAGPPDRLKGLIELRGIGIMRVPFKERMLDLAVDLLPAGSSVDQLPEPMTASWLGLSLPKVMLDARAPSAVAKLRMILTSERVY